MPSRRRSRRKRRQAVFASLLVFLVVVAFGIGSCLKQIADGQNAGQDPFAAQAIDVSPDPPQAESPTPPEQEVSSKPEEPVPPPPYPTQTAGTAAFDDTLNAAEAVLLDVQDNTVLAQRGADARIYPASLTKIMTVLVAAEHIDNMDDTFTMTYDILAPLYEADATQAGFSEDEQVSMRDLFYGAVLPSGADAAVALAEVVSGSETSFVTLMNKKAQELGLKDTHFVNVSGLHDGNHYSTVTDLAVILEAAMENPLCKELLSTYQYTTAPTPQHPEGILLTSTMFSRMYGTEVEGVTITSGKTGYTDEAMHCLASFAVNNADGRTYIAVTTGGSARYQPIYDSFKIFGNYLKPASPAETTVAQTTAVETSAG